MHRTDPLRKGGCGSEGERGRGENRKQGTLQHCSKTVFLPYVLWKIFNSSILILLYTPIFFPSLVQKGAVCQWWLSWVKQVRPGMLQVSLFWSLLRNFRSFFLRFCSFCSHWLFCFDGTLMRMNHIQYYDTVKKQKKRMYSPPTSVSDYLSGWMSSALNLKASLFLKR